MLYAVPVLATNAMLMFPRHRRVDVPEIVYRKRLFSACSCIFFLIWFYFLLLDKHQNEIDNLYAKNIHIRSSKIMWRTSCQTVVFSLRPHSQLLTYIVPRTIVWIQGLPIVASTVLRLCAERHDKSLFFLCICGSEIMWRTSCQAAVFSFHSIFLSFVWFSS